MSQPFEITFDFALAPSDLIIPLRAIAELHHSDPYYVIDNIRFAGAPDQPGHHPVLPEFEIKQIRNGKEIAWVHCDSEKETLLSISAGKAIEKSLHERGAASGQ